MSQRLTYLSIVTSFILLKDFSLLQQVVLSGSNQFQNKELPYRISVFTSNPKHMFIRIQNLSD
jgi:hypothetical protein